MVKFTYALPVLVLVIGCANPEATKVDSVAAELLMVSTFAGSGEKAEADGTGTAAKLKGPYGVAYSAASGNLYVSDLEGHTIRKITAEGVVTTLAGSAGFQSTQDGTGSGARFDLPAQIAVDLADNVYVIEAITKKIRKVTSAGVVTTITGTTWPNGLATDEAGNLYIADYTDHTISKRTPQGVITVFAGSGTAGSANGTGAAASFDHPNGLAADGAGSIYVADHGNNSIRKITSAGVVTTFATGLVNVTDVAVDGFGNVYVTDIPNHVVKKFNTAGGMTVLAGNGTEGSENGPASKASFAFKTGNGAALTVKSGASLDDDPTVFVAEYELNLIRMIH